jgi:protein-S-isoprenylcysteine O-methyltransferase Ste14
LIGRNWSSNVTVKEDHQLMRTGPYALVRHPIFAGLLLGMLGTALQAGEVRGLIGMALATIAWRTKLIMEEQFMTEQFGAEYASYKRDVKALVPFIW